MLKENFTGFLEKSIKSNWDINALADYGGNSFTYAEVAHHIVRLHAIFRLSGLEKGEKVALIGKNSAAWAITFLATVTYGAVIVPILPDFTPEDVRNIISHSDSKLLFAGESSFEIRDMTGLPELKAVFGLSTFQPQYSGKGTIPEDIDILVEKDLLSKYGHSFSPGDFNIENTANTELAEISYTSGTTGYSKGVMLSHNSLIANIKYAHEHMPLEPRDNIVSFLPLAHSYGCAFEFLFPFTLGCHITFLGKVPTPQIIMQAFGEIHPRLILSVPLVIEKIYRKQLLPVISRPVMKILLRLPGIKGILHTKIRGKLTAVFGGNFHEVVIGGAAFNKDAEDFFHAIRFPFTIGYGMTECGPLISYDGWRTTRLRSAGKIVDSLEVRIDSGDPFNEVGEILVRGENVMMGYYKNETATREVIDKDGWLHTGDLGVIDRDNYIYIRGRSKDMLLGASGQNIYPEEIEARINNLPYVLESVVIREKDRLVALIFPDKELMDKENIDEEALMQIMKDNRKDLNQFVAGYMNVAEFRIHPEEFEKTPKKSIKRFLYTR